MTYPYYGSMGYYNRHWNHWNHPLNAGLHHPFWHGAGLPFGYGGHHAGMYSRHFGNPFHFYANWGYDYNYYPNPDLLPKDEEEFRKNMPKYEVPLIYSPTRSPARGSPSRSMGDSPRRKDILDRQKAITREMNAMKHPRVSSAVDFIDPIYKHLDPISVSLQERVKFGGHITSITRST